MAPMEHVLMIVIRVRVTARRYALLVAASFQHVTFFGVFSTRHVLDERAALE